MNNYYLDAYDATHLATAIHMQQFLDSQGYPPCVFVSADERLNHAAVAEGLETQDPNQHP